MINTMENIAPEELAALDLFQNCRLCLAKDKVSVDIFNEAAEVRLLYCKIVSCLPLHFSKEDDKLPRKICTQCNEKVDNFYNFWTLTAKTQKTLLDWVQQREIVTTKIKTENIAPSEISFKQEYIDNSDVDDNDRYDDDNESEEDVEPTTVVKTLCDETDGESAGPSTVNIKSSQKPELVKVNPRDRNHFAFNMLMCKTCVFATDSDTQFFLHSRDCKKKEKSFKCTDCKVMFKTRHNFLSHLKTVHRVLGKTGNFQCNICNRCFKYKYQIGRHVRWHLPECYHCDFCKRNFGSKFHFGRHIRSIHLGEDVEPLKKYKCNTCKKNFHSRTAIIDHFRDKSSHVGMTSFGCDLCGARFYSKKSVSKHRLQKHPSAGKPKLTFMCDVCGKSYTDRNSYKRHHRVAHGGQMYTCHICNKQLSRKGNFEAHLRTHTGERPFSCEICGKSFKSVNTLRVHKLVHTDKTPFVCLVCTKGFKTRGALGFHFKRLHPGIEAHSLG